MRQFTLTWIFLNRDGATNGGGLTPIPCEAGHTDKATGLVGIGIASIETLFSCLNNIFAPGSLALGVSLRNSI